MTPIANCRSPGATPVPATSPRRHPSRGHGSQALAARCRCLPVLNRGCRDPRSRPANEPPTVDQKARPPPGDQAPDLHFLV